ncbi:Hypothetical protein CINCED_3A021840 [Cinara cedri]|uniref:Uncharacterized protein n=1 Tax=Cinara cedri TaxID=506608 RepID=A0A5E4MPC9_9HEMI|nr:Hypothetical protein CINCED_3A021840 [Cinara cedri]
MGGKSSNSLRVLTVAAAASVIACTVTPQLVFANSTADKSLTALCPPDVSSLVGDTMCSTNGVPFEWASNYEVAVVYITTMWSEFEYTGTEESTVRGAVAKNGFLNYCVRFKNKLAVWSKSLQNESDVNETVEKTVSSWYQAVDSLSRNNWDLPEISNLESFRKQFKTSFKHLIINGSDVYGKANDAKLKRNVNDFTREIASIMIGLLKEISKQIRNVPDDDYDTTVGV